MSGADKILYLGVDAIVELHDLAIKQYGGGTGIRDITLIEAAVGRYQSGYYADIIEEAAALMESLLQNHPFVDGNKRTAFLAVGLFLRQNGYEIIAESMEIYDALIGLFERQEISHANLVALLEKMTKEND